MLTDTKIRSLKPREKSYRVADHNGLCIEIRQSGTKLWCYRYRFDGKASMLSLGEYPAVSLSDARKARDEARALLSDGKNPAQIRKTEKIEASIQNANTFELVAKEYITEILKDRSSGYLNKITKSLEIDIYPIIGSKNVSEVSAAEVLYIARSTVSRVRTTGKRGTGEITALNNTPISTF
ncbi:MAG: integrase arm-type DNA-binding domain-containing protein [Acinetobacter sp.]|uniref:tyrosine-type recombinase/integrase n=1 Tax=Acinetobacter sp. TaxID=472 RepID=UPI0026166A62|nr:integrase arm-type DNA-binding domain-containing protein [Acinetobacter sp.]MDD2945614.1 integrase arm-type DNA-binding domain-containing protein [Acinetobacter sp.]